MSRRPNIVFFLSDQHSPHFLGHDGNDIVRTPSIDRLAADGATFRRAYCQNPLCVPSRASLISGKYSRNLGIYDNQDVMEANSLTIPRHFGQFGYRTCLIGKAHFNGEQFHGYHERPYGDLYGQSHQPDPGRLPERGKSGLGDWPYTAGPSGIPLAMTQTEICVAESAKWLQTHTRMHPDQPFFLSVHFDKPHFPVNPPEQFYEHYSGAVSFPDVPDDAAERHVPFVQAANAGFFNQGRYRQGDEASLRLLASYYGCVEWIDDALGRILSVIDYLGIREDTIVVYSSDHGEMAGEHGCWQKTKFFDASARVPLLIRWPGIVPSGQKIDDLVGLIDLFPTLCDLSGIDIPDSDGDSDCYSCDGESLRGRLCDGVPLHREGIFSESVVLKHPEYAGCMYRTGDWKFNYYLDGHHELYDLAEDPSEYRNLIDLPETSDLVRDYTQRVEAFWNPDEQIDRYARAPRMRREKHFYEFSNQFVLGNGQVVDAQP